MKLYFIRHGATQGNREHRYLGCTDEGILEAEKERLRQKSRDFPVMDAVFASPYLRCRQTAELLFGKNRTKFIEELREMDFGEFEYKNYQELSGNADYQKYIGSGGTIGFPGGEQPEDFKFRCREAFRRCIREACKNRWEHVALVAHGGTIMAILEAFGYPRKRYFEYQVGNGCGYICTVKDGEFPEYQEEAAHIRGKNSGEAPKRTASGGERPEYDKKTIRLMIEEEIV
ncbi:putative phosphoserine phosphatase 2 [Lachnospiraceae bacterium]|nr:putative phosphoserine phosphatase 2 [Lachnospiraceae bacterium]